MNMNFERKLAIPMEVKEMYPLTGDMAKIVDSRAQEIKNILSGKSDKLMLVIGPCSADNEDSVIDYISRLVKVQEQVKAKGGITNITTKYTTANKETKIIVNSPWVKEHCLFKDDTIIRDDKEYRRALNFLCTYTMAGKNKKDDVPDAFAMLSEFCQSLVGNKVEVFARPF